MRVLRSRLPQRNVTTTPRQRIVLRREMARQSQGSPLLALLQDECDYDGIETCTADGTCAIPCLASTNTVALIKTVRRARQSGGAFIVSRERTVSSVSCARYDARPAGG